MHTENAKNIATRIGTASVLLFAFFAWLGVSGAAIAMGLMLIAALPFARQSMVHWPRDPILIVAALFVLYTCISAFAASREFPDTAALQWSDARHWSLLMMFPVVAWWLRNDKRLIQAFLMLAGGGFLLDFLLAFEWKGVYGAFSGEPFNYRKAINALGFYSGTILLGLIVFAARFWGTARQNRHFVLRAVLWLVLFAFFLLYFILTKSRASWISLVGAVLVIAPFMIWQNVRLAMQRNIRIYTAISLVALLTATGILYNYSNMIQSRIASEVNTAKAMLTGNLQNIPYSSLGLRIHIGAYGLEKWLARPLMGYGPADSKILIRQHPMAQLQNLSHFHNSYIELLVRFGVIGFCLFVTLIALLLRRVTQLYRCGEIKPDMYLFLLGAFVMLGIWSLSNHRMTHTDWRFYWLLLSGLAYSPILFTTRPSKTVLERILQRLRRVMLTTPDQGTDAQNAMAQTK